MTPALRRYLTIEMTVAAAISAVLSVVFVLLLFGAPAMVPVAGSRGLIVDAIPQSAMIALMSSLVPTLLTRRRVRAGTIALRPGRSCLPHHAGGRALLVAVAAAILGGLVHVALLPLGPAEWRFAGVLVYKPLYGALLGGAVARCAVIAALAGPTAPDPAGRAASTGRRAG